MPASALHLLSAKLQKIRGKIKNVGAPTFLGGVYPPFFAYVWERKELLTGGVYVGEGKELGEESLQSTVNSLQRRKRAEDFTAEDTESTEVRESGRKWKIENGPPSRKGVASAGLRGGMWEGGSGVGGGIG
jgi:hypothetical protein